ncbi:MAG TPA: hypothetical protein VHL31_08570 [Geminicoccus sp.]|jgi:hypothetical protein|uniref:hypothetical protein n=1 Tax=Geminicoccus sp. TaxID=2024832 RepID=UPI002E33D537|nr:hypothetical protein [Geminicoccus sp.]HEX2526343.1 hypothetical protein [Geminicoccus sp.]
MTRQQALHRSPQSKRRHKQVALLAPAALPKASRRRSEDHEALDAGGDASEQELGLPRRFQASYGHLA